MREKGLGDMTQCAADRDMFNDDPADLDGDHADIEDPQPGDQMHKNKICEVTCVGIFVKGIGRAGNRTAALLITKRRTRCVNHYTKRPCDPEVEYLNNLEAQSQRLYGTRKDLVPSVIKTTIAGVWCSYSFDHKLLIGRLTVYKRCL